MSIQSPSLTPLRNNEYKKQMEGVENIPEYNMSTEKRSSSDNANEELPSKRQKCLTPDITIIEDEEVEENSSTSLDVSSILKDSTNKADVDASDKEKKKAEQKLAKQQLKEAGKLAKQKKKEEERLEKERKKEQDRLDKERKKEDEKLQRERKKEEERLEKERKKEEERLEKERKKEEERLEKERKKEEERLDRERKKEEERLDKERKKEEERLERERKKEEERVERERKKEEERLKREEEKRKQEEEKAKGQRKIASFFSVNSRKSPQKAKVENEIKETDGAYEKQFLPFFQKKTVIVAPSLQLSSEQLASSKAKFESLLSSDSVESESFFDSYNYNCNVKSVKISPDEIINALNSPETTEDTIYQMIQGIPPIKYLQFYENTRPPYIGTWCSKEHIDLHFPVLEPFNKEKTGFDYDYDSGLDWDGDEEGEGDDIDDDDMDDDDDLEEAEEEDMDDFVDDDSKKKKRFIGPLVPVCQWKSDNDFNDMKYQMLVNVDIAIDPFKRYFENNEPQSTQIATPAGKNTIKSILTNSSPATTPVRLLTGIKPIIKDDKVVHQLMKFVEENISFSIGTLTELAKSKEPFKQFTKAMLKHTIQDIAIYNKSNSNWEVKKDLKERLHGLYGA